MSISEPGRRGRPEKRPGLGQTVFVDRDLDSDRLVHLLRRAGFSVERHRDHFEPAEEDAVWIAAVSHHGWVILTADERIKRETPNKEAIRASASQVVLASNCHMIPEVWASALILRREKLRQLISRHPGPVILSISPAASEHVRRLNVDFASPG